jgi:hypothetical protein
LRAGCGKDRGSEKQQKNNIPPREMTFVHY